MVGAILMLQVILLTALLSEFALYVWLGRLLTQQGLSIALVVSILLLLALLWRLSHALGSFVVTSILRWRDGRALPLGNSLAALANEFAARFVCFNWSQAFPQWAVGADPCGARKGVPILLVHGYVCNRGLWVTFRRTLAAAGLGPIYTVTLEPLFGGIDTLVSRLDARIEAICKQTGATEVMIVAHSMGGLLVRAYLVQATTPRVSRLVTLGSPHQGTRLAKLGFGTNASQMRDQCEWLKCLAANEAVQAAKHDRKLPTTLSIYTLNDDLVYPPESSVLAWAENVPVAAIGHMGLVFSPSVARRVTQHLR